MRLIALLLILILLAPPAFAMPVTDNRAYLIGDFEEGRILQGYDIDTPHYIASITKIMTYLVIREHLDAQGIDPATVWLTVPAEAVRMQENSIKLTTGEKILLSDCIEAMMIYSANDAANMVAIYHSGSKRAFGDFMTKRAHEMGLTSARFINPSGLSEGGILGDANTMSARDIFTLSRHLLRTYPELLELGRRDELSIPYRNFQRDAIMKYMRMAFRGVDGLKTGLTTRAGHCSVVTRINHYQDPRDDYRVITVQLGAEDGEKRARQIYDMLFTSMRSYPYRAFSDRIGQDGLTYRHFTSLPLFIEQLPLLHAPASSV